VSRIVLLAALAVLVAAGCGGSPRLHSAALGLPRELARTWASRADAVATAAAAGNRCLAQQLASSLRDDVIAAEGKVPTRLRRPLLLGVNSLADRIVCTPAPAAPPHQQQPKPPKPHDHHGHSDEKGKHQ
jgi:hypothetical protein